MTDDDDGFVVLQGDSYAEFLQVEGLGLDALSPVQVANILNSDHQFFKVLLRMI